MSIRKRAKIADVMRGAQRMGCTSHPTFRAAFPQIETIRVVVEEAGDGVSSWMRGPMVYTSLDNLQRFVNCKNPLCYSGGVDFNDAIMWIVFDCKTEYRDNSHCRGHEGSPKGRKDYGPCLNRFKVSIVITYKPDAGTAARSAGREMEPIPTSNHQANAAKL